MKQTILVTGGTGFIGSHTTVELQEAGYDVVIVDNLSNSKIEVLDGIEKITGIRPAFEEVKQPTMWIRMKPLLYMAAMFIGAALIIRVASSNHQPTTAGDHLTANEAATEVVSDEYIDVALDRSMLDDYSLYVYLSDATAE